MNEGVTLTMSKARIDLEAISLIIFGDFGVLTNTPFRDYAPLHMLPGRVEYLTRLREERMRAGGALLYAVAGNKGGVAFGIQSEEEAEAEVRWTAEQIGAETYAVCFAHPEPAPGYEEYAYPEQLKRRKPAPGMLEEIIAQLGVPRERVLVVGNFADDCRGAKNAGLAWEVTGVFFAGAQPQQVPLEEMEPPYDVDFAEE
jgi:histidinol phosphatase-like enzyme